MKHLVLCLLFGSFIGKTNAQQSAKPKLIVGIVIDQMRWDFLYRYSERYSNGGFNRLLHKGFNCQNTYLNYVPSYTAPGHTSIYTGSVPAIHGIVGNDWIDPKSKQSVYCASDETVQSIGGSQKAGKMSPRAMKTTTIGDELRLASNFRSRVFGVALKDRGAIFPAGHSGNGAFWFDDSTGNFISSSFYASKLPFWLQQFNEKRWADTLLAQNWESLYPIGSYKQSIADENEYEYLKMGESKPIFPHQISGEGYKQIRSLPAGNSLSFKLAKALIKGEQLGQKKETDLLCISLSSSDYIGHTYAPNSVEVEDMYLRLDKDIASFLAYLDRHFGEDNYLLFLSADHGAAHNAPFLEDHKMPAGTFSENELKQQLNDFLNLKFKTANLINAVMNYQVFINDEAVHKNKLNRATIKEAIVNFCQQQEAIASAYDATNLAMLSLPTNLKTAIINGYYPTRCGDVGLVFQPAWHSDGKKGTTHGTWNPYDSHIPLLWYGWGIAPGESFERYEVTDIAATIAALMHIQVPNGSVGKVIKMNK